MHRYLTLFLALQACTVQIAGTDTTITIKGKVRAAGQPVAGASVNAVDVSTTTSSSGEFTLSVKPVEDRVTIEVNATGYAPNLSVVRRRAEVFQYHADIELFRPTTRTMPMAGGMDSFTVMAGGQEIGISAPPGTLPPGTTLEVTAFPAENGPGTMETAEGTDKLLQTGGMLYIRAVDSSGKPVPLGGDGLKISPGQMTDIGPTGVTQGYSIDSRAVWSPQTMNSVGNDKTLAAREAGFWNCDRNFRTTCIKGRVKSSGKRCGGEKVRAGSLGGNSDLYSQDTAGPNGEFCVEGPAGLGRTLTVGSTNTDIDFPRNPGSCRQELSACKDIGEVTVSDADCPLSCAIDEIDTPTGCEKLEMPQNTGGGGGSTSTNAAGFTCLGTQQCTPWNRGSSSCQWRSCACADAAGGATCVRAWYETNSGRVFACGQCTATCNSAAESLIASCQ